MEYIIDQLEEGCFVTSLLLDFSKAFDCLNHDHLHTPKTRTQGIKGKKAEWFSNYSYLKRRKQPVEIKLSQQKIKH